MGFNDAPSVNKNNDPLGIEKYENERDVRMEKITTELKNLHTHEMDAILALIDGFKAQSK